ncbi:MAG: dihydroorotate dehydrogenase [Candidatus Kerfeldbacteria bacterium]|nr:dihydroorotate dehydrogenase [Candidatus Kerfeldbacteria bacterium]
MDLFCTCLGLELEHPVMNAAGTCKHLDGDLGVQQFSRSATAMIMVGSATIESRLGNSGDVYYHDTYFSLNSIGLANPGIEYYRRNLPEMNQISHGVGKPLGFSIAGFTPDEYAMMAKVAAEAHVDLIELNLGCPNIWDGGKQKRIASFDPTMIAAILDAVTRQIGTSCRLSVKLSPIADPYLLQQVGSCLSAYPIVKAITVCNTFPNALALKTNGQPEITPASGLGGLAGAALKPIALGQIHQLHTILGEQVSYIGVGGITTGADVRDFLHAGASCVQIATPIMNQGLRSFSIILDGLID